MLWKMLALRERQSEMRGLIDMHCHIVPGVDDGARDLYDAAKILQLEYKNQVQAVIVTPHYRVGMFETPQKEIERQFQRIDEMTRRSRSGMRAYLGCEYYTNIHMVEDLKQGRRPTMIGTEYVLTEFSERHNYQLIRNQVYALLGAGYRPIIAHAERYPCLSRTPALVEELVQMGAQIQLTSANVLGKGGWRQKRFCHKMIERKLVHYIASDAHDQIERKPDLLPCAEFVSKKYGQQTAEQIFIQNPSRIIKKSKKMQDKRRNQ